MSFNKELYIIAGYLYKEIKISSFFMPNRSVSNYFNKGTLSKRRKEVNLFMASQ